MRNRLVARGAWAMPAELLKCSSRATVSVQPSAFISFDKDAVAALLVDPQGPPEATVSWQLRLKG